MSDDYEEPMKDPDSKEDEDYIVKCVKRHRKEFQESMSEWREEARECYAFVAGEQWSTEDKAKLEEQMRLPVVFNRIGPMVDSVSGSEINNRQQVQYIPRQPGDSGVNELLSGAADYFRQNCDADDEESDSFLDTVICGVGCTETHLDYVDNPEGMVCIDRRDPLSLAWDPSAKKRNLSDRKWDQVDDWMLKADIEEQWPDKADQIAVAYDWTSPAEDISQPVDQQLAWLYASGNSIGYDKKTGRALVTHEQWFELEDYYRLLDPMQGQIVEMEVAQYRKIEKRMKAMGVTLQSVKRQRKVWKQAFVCGDILLETGPVPCNDGSRKFITGKRDRNNNTWFGIVRAMIDPQRWANKFFSQLLHIVNTNAKGGLMMEEGAVKNLRKFKEEWSKSDSVSLLNPGALSKGMVQPKIPPVVPPQVNELLQFSISSLRDVTGINLELLGMADREQAGVLEAQRKQAALTVLASMFDALHRYRKEQGRLLAKYIREYLSDGRLVRIAGKSGTEQYIPLLRDPESMEYDVVVDEMPNTVNQKEKTFAILMQLLPNLERMGVPFAPELLEYSPLPTAMVSQWTELIKQREQQPKQPDPRMISAQAQATAAQAKVMDAQGNVAKDQADAMAQPQEFALRQTELQIQGRELEVRAMEAQAKSLSAQANIRKSALDSLGLNPSGNGNGPAAPRTM